ncbi:endonuclease/exonuclease/phosphatase family protein [Leekyejoonella antrihumi]|uniref:Endonuclease/exonuclease/phosphatase domain-containing protein n=1 Tax=Leekyejoonella antrihumi TaxID=1660198 RepID=A0A563E3U8_9MICO|nr:endonuclease/exonuclease/phosphatase family protein [Leekyejoonella antrihumi]TWP36979.1 hypothetical protein FGL98_07945 [Leekyejoonella antrihumi]
MSRTSAILRVATYNVRALKDDRDALIRVVRSIDPDVLCLQEAPRHPFSGHRVAALATDLGLTWSGGHRGRMSTTLLTGLRVDVLSSAHRNLPVRRFDEPRGYAVATVRLPGQAALRVASVHLSLRAEERPLHARGVLDAVAGDVPVVVAGDLNETDDGPAWSALATALRDVGPRTPTVSASEPVRRIDTILVSVGLLTRDPELALDERDLAAASDHLPVVVDILLPASDGPAE